MFNWKSFAKPIVALSPMADMTDSPFCQIAKRFGCPIVFREMISAEAVVRESVKTMKMAGFDEVERPIIQQLFGSDPKSMGEATRRIDEAFSPDGFDINMGCPVYKIVSNFNGAALMNEPERAANIVKAMKSATTKPVSVKIRLGWNDPTQCLDFVKVLEQAGADLITIHGRTKAQAYSGSADWEMIGRAKKQTSVLVLANGDITNGETANLALSSSGADGVLIARGALGNPWVFKDIAAGLNGSAWNSPTLSERIAIIIDHLRMHVAHYGPRSVTTFRKHLSYYLKGQPQVRDFRDEFMKASDIVTLEKLLHQYLLTVQSNPGQR